MNEILSKNRLSDLESEVLQVRQGVNEARAESGPDSVEYVIVADDSLLVAWGVDMLDGVTIFSKTEKEMLDKGLCPDCGEPLDDDDDDDDGWPYGVV